MLSKILKVLVLLVAVFAVVAAMQPEDFQVSRSLKMNAPAAVVFAQVNNLHKWDAWSPWAKLDPNAKETFGGPESGKGAVMSWAGNMQVGEGSMTITESRPTSLIAFRLDFLKPMAATNTAEFHFNGEGAQTEVVWTMSGKRNFMAKAMSLIFNCEKMVGGQFEKGLASLKGIVEGAK